MNSQIPRITLILIILAGLVALPQVVESRYYMRLVNVAGIYVILVIGYNLLYGLAGQLSFGHAGFFGIGAYTVGVATVQAGLSPWVGLIGAVVLTTLVGIIIGIPTLRVRGHYLALATIAFGEIVRQILLNWKSVTRGYDGILGIPGPSLGPFSFEGDRSVYYLILFFALLAFVIAERIKHSTYGRAMFAVNDSQLAAEVMGVNATQTKVLAFAASAFYAGIAGALYSFMFGFISPDAFEFDVSVAIVAMLLVGGVGSTLGAAVGAVVLTFLPEVLRIGERYYMIFYGVVFLAILIFLPQGIVGTLEGLIRRIIRRLTARPDAVSVAGGSEEEQNKDSLSHERENPVRP